MSENNEMEEVYEVKRQPEYQYKRFWKSLAQWAEECRDDKDLPFEERLMFRMLCYEMSNTELIDIIDRQNEKIEQLEARIKGLEELR